MRDKFKKLAVEEATCPTIEWNCGADLPLTWEKEELKKMMFSTIKVNYRKGAITESTYKRLMQHVRAYV